MVELGRIDGGGHRPDALQGIPTADWWVRGVGHDGVELWVMAPDHPDYEPERGRRPERCTCRCLDCSTRERHAVHP